MIYKFKGGEVPTSDEQVRRMLDELLKNYNPMLRPNYLGEPVKVTVDATILSISNIDEVINTKIIFYQSPA